MGIPPAAKLVDDLSISIAGEQTSGWVHVNHSFFCAFELHIVIGAAQCLELRIGQGWIEDQAAGYGTHVYR
jgi:hypothetical protein